MIKGNVLCVEDNSSLKFLLKTVLGKEFHVTCVSGAFEAFGFLTTSEDIDCIILSIESKEDENLALYSQLKTSAALQNIPVLVLSSMQDEWIYTFCRQNDVAGFFSKPFDPLVLLNLIKAVSMNNEHLEIVFQKPKTPNLKLNPEIRILIS